MGTIGVKGKLGGRQDGNYRGESDSVTADGIKAKLTPKHGPT